MHQVVPAGDFQVTPRATPNRLARAWYQLKKTAKSPTPYLTVFGILLWLFVYWLLCEGLKLPRFVKLPGPVTVLSEWLSPNPEQGISIFTPEYYQHIYVSCRRIFIAFCIATSIGVPLGLVMGWSRTFRDYMFPILEVLRPIPILAWVPLAILMFSGDETAGHLPHLPGLVLRHRRSTPCSACSRSTRSTVRAADCLGASRWQVFRHVVVPGALPFIFTGLQISIGVPGSRSSPRRWCRAISASATDQYVLREGRHRTDRHRHDHARLRRLVHLARWSASSATG